MADASSRMGLQNKIGRVARHHKRLIQVLPDPRNILWAPKHAIFKNNSLRLDLVEINRDCVVYILLVLFVCFVVCLFV